MISPYSGYVQVEHGKLYYAMKGSGPSLVLIHAGFLDHRMWDDQIEILARDHRVIRYDVRGFGRSDRPQKKYSDSADLLALLKHQDIGRATVVGVSNGGRIALDFAVEHPDRVEALILIAPGVSGYESTGPEEDALWQGYEAKEKAVKEAFKGGRIPEAVEIYFDLWTRGLDPAARKRLLAIAMDNSHVLDHHPGELNVAPDPPAFQRLSEIKVPTLLIVGDRDVPGMMSVVDRIHARIRGSRKVLIPGADHIVNMSKPREFNQVVLDFLKEKRGPQGEG